MIIGLVGGMGSIATVDYFRRLIDAFPAQKEWDRPRIIIDNRCDIPSRVRGILYGEKTKEIVASLIESIQMMIAHKCDYIVLLCNTSHYYLNAIYEQHPGYEKKIIHIIDLLAQTLNTNNVTRCRLIASEGTYLTKIYNKSLQIYNISYIENDERQTRAWIEAVKTHRVTEDIKKDFINTVNNFQEQNVILGCTELPVLYSICKNSIHKNVYDPLECTINYLTKAYYTENNTHKHYQ